LFTHFALKYGEENLTQLNVGNANYQATRKAPPEFHKARYAYIDELVLRIKKAWDERDIDRLMLMYAPKIEEIRTQIARHFNLISMDDINYATKAEFIHLIDMYKAEMEVKLSFSSWIKRFYIGWCYRHMNQFVVLPRANRHEINNDSSIDNVTVDDSKLSYEVVDKEDFVKGLEVRDSVRSALREVRGRHGDKAEDALIFLVFFKISQQEIAQIMGITQAKVSKLIQDAKETFKEELGDIL
jgi:RNA polymerase sigma factor (sigma-70 family)